MFTYDEMDAVFQALAHEHRRRILDLVNARPGLSVGQIAQDFDVSRIAVMNHLGVLERAGVIVSRKDGRSRRFYLNAVPIQLIYDRWTSQYSAHWARRLSDIKYAAEDAERSKRVKK
jgi:DNA-binding transcriptional ArsR family regulator